MGSGVCLPGLEVCLFPLNSCVTWPICFLPLIPHLEVGVMIVATLWGDCKDDMFLCDIHMALSTTPDPQATLSEQLLWWLPLLIPPNDVFIEENSRRRGHLLYPQK